MFQILGGYIACLLIYVQWGDYIAVRCIYLRGNLHGVLTLSLLMPRSISASPYIHLRVPLDLDHPTHLSQEVIELLEASGKLDEVMFTANGPAGIFALYASPTANLGRVFLNEFVCVSRGERPSTACQYLTLTATLQDFLIALVIWSCIDPTNFSAPPAAAPWIVSFV